MIHRNFPHVAVHKRNTRDSEEGKEKVRREGIVTTRLPFEYSFHV